MQRTPKQVTKRDSCQTCWDVLLETIISIMASTWRSTKPCVSIPRLWTILIHNLPSHETIHQEAKHIKLACRVQFNVTDLANMVTKQCLREPKGTMVHLAIGTLWFRSIGLSSAQMTGLDFLVSTKGNVWKIVWGIWILMLGCKG